MANAIVTANNGTFFADLVTRRNHRDFGERTPITLLLDAYTPRQTHWVGFRANDAGRINIAFSQECFISKFLDHQMNTFNRFIFWEPGVLAAHYTLGEFFRTHAKERIMLDPPWQIDFDKPSVVTRPRED